MKIKTDRGTSQVLEKDPAYFFSKTQTTYLSKNENLENPLSNITI